MSVVASDILDTLDDAGQNFPALVTFTWRFGGGRLHAFANDKDWAIVIEEWTYGVTGHVDGFPLVLHSFGSRLPKRNRDAIWLKPIKRGPCKFLCFDTDEDEPPYQTQRLHPQATDVKIHGKVVAISHEPADYRRLKIKLEHKDAILKAELHPYLAETYREHVFATKAELGITLPLVLRLDDWLHPDMDQLPSETKSFQQIASALESRDPSRYKLRRGNTRWNQRE